MATAVVEMLTQIQERVNESRAERGYLDQVRDQGAEKASERAAKTLAAVYKAVGFIPAR